MGFIAFFLSIIILVFDAAVLRVLTAIFVGIAVFFDFATTANNNYETSFAVQAIIDAIRDELLLPVCLRIDGIIFLRTVQMDRNTTLSDYRDQTDW
jgi:hypothetical protein